MKIKWLRKALKNLETIHEYISALNREAAKQTVAKIRIGIDKLAEFPQMGRPGRVKGTRELIIGNTPYIVIYRVKQNNIEILRILHSARKFP